MGFGPKPYALTKAAIDAVLGYDVDVHAGRHRVLPTMGPDLLDPHSINAPHLDSDLRVPRDWLNDPSLSAAGLFRSRIGKNLAEQVLEATHQVVSQIANLGGGVLVAGTRQTADPWDGAIHRSVDYGATWTTVQTFSGQAILSCIPLPGGIVLAGSANSKLYRSTDRGLTWTEITVVTGVVNISNLTYCGNGVVIAGAISKWAKSTDYGATWVEKGAWGVKYMGGFPGACAYLENDILIIACRSQFASDQLTVARSTDYGESWSGVTVGYPTNRDMLAICYLGNGIVLASSTADVVAKSTDYGLTWSLHTVQDALSALVYLGDGLVLGGSNYSKSGKSSIWRTEDYGTTWAEESHAAIANSGNHYWLEFLRNGVLLAATGPGCKLLRSEEWPLESGKGGGELALADMSLAETPADGTWSGLVMTLTAGEALSKYDVCYRDVTTTKVKKAQANAAGTVPALYMALADIAQDASGPFLAIGRIANSGWGWTIGDELLVSDDVAGGMTQTLPADPGDQVQRVGMAESATVVYFKPDVTVVEVA